MLVPNIWFKASIKVINKKTNKWKTVGKCLDTPNSIKEKVKELKFKGYNNLWLFSNTEGKKPLF